MGSPSIDDLKGSQGFRQYDPGVYVNDDSFGQGMAYLPDSSNPLGYRSAKISDLGIGNWQNTPQKAPDAPPTPPPGDPMHNVVPDDPTLVPHPWQSAPDARPDPTRQAPPSDTGPMIGADPTGGPPQAVPQTPTTPSSSGASPTSVAGFTNPIRQSLLDRIAFDQQPVTLDDPALNPQMSTFSTLQNRAVENQRNAIAERNAARGLLSSGQNDTDMNQLNEDAALGKASYGANLVGSETNARRSELDNLLGLGTQTSTSDLNRNLTGALGIGDLTLRDKLGSGQLNLGAGDLALRDKLGTGQLDLGTLQTLLGNQQSNNLLGYYYANLGNNMNRDLILNGILQ